MLEQVERAIKDGVLDVNTAFGTDSVVFSGHYIS